MSKGREMNTDVHVSTEAAPSFFLFRKEKFSFSFLSNVLWLSL